MGGDVIIETMRNATVTIRVIVALLVLTPLPTKACLNDRDSDALAAEAKRLPITISAQTRAGADFPGLVEIITGRFPRNSALYYQLRITRCQRELAATPNQLALYDDISVAYDKLGKSGEALVWIEKKRARIPKTDTEALYRYFANVGTFRAHHWLREGAKDERRGELMQARDEIAKAIELKPDAHFGREAYQLQAMEWLLNAHEKQSLAYYIGHSESHDNDKAILGLAGLVVLGNAWESVDIFGALAGQLNQRGDAKIGFLAELRCRELMENGKVSLFESVEFPERTRRSGPEYLIVPPPRNIFGITNPKNVIAKYKELRAAAEKWQVTRTNFMEARLKTGHHPDNDPHFWDGYKDTPAPSLDIPWQKEAAENFNNLLMRSFYFAPFILILTIPVIVGLVQLRRFLTRRRTR